MFFFRIITQVAIDIDPFIELLLQLIKILLIRLPWGGVLLRLTLNERCTSLSFDKVSLRRERWLGDDPCP